MVLYSLGQFGWSLASFSVGNLVTYFYFPPNADGSSEIPALIVRSAIFIGLTVIGLANFTGRIFDGITDPIIAGMTDRSKNRFGRRRIYMISSFIPFAFLSIMVFTPPTDNVSTINAVWVFISIMLFYFFMTMYVQAYGALIPEIGQEADDRMFLATMTSVTWAMGFAVGQTTWAIKGLFQDSGMTPITAIRTVIVIFAVVSAVFMAIPIIVIDEKKHCRGHVSNEGTFTAVVKAFQNRDFAIFTASDFCYFVANTFLEIGIIYYVTMLMGMSESQATLLMTVMFVTSFMFYVPIFYIAKKVGKKKLLVTAFIMQSVLFAMIPMIKMVSRPDILGWVIIILEAIPVALFGIVPTAIIADIAKSDGIRTGNYKEAVFYGARSFFMKLAISITNLIFPTLLMIGSVAVAGSEPRPTTLGVSMTAVVAFFFAVAGAIILYWYKEGRINHYLALEEEHPEGEVE